MQLSEKIVLITGGTAGIGFAIAARALKEGAKAVVVTGRDELRGCAAEKELGADAVFIAHDVVDEEGWEALAAAVIVQFGRFDVLVNNAGWIGTGAPQDPESLGLAEWRAVLAPNLDGVFLGCRTGIRFMRNWGGGSIVNVSSTAGLMSTPAFAAYGAAKAAVAQLTKSVAVYCARRGYGIRCNSVHPSLVDTSMAAEIFQLFGGPRDKAEAAYLARVPLGALGTAADVAAGVTYLASDDACYVTGSQLVVGGGLGV